MTVMSMRETYVDDRKSGVNAIFMNMNTLTRIHCPWIMDELLEDDNFMNLEHSDWVYIHSICSVLDRNQRIYN